MKKWKISENLCVLGGSVWEMTDYFERSNRSKSLVRKFILWIQIRAGIAVLKNFSSDHCSPISPFLIQTITSSLPPQYNHPPLLRLFWINTFIDRSIINIYLLFCLLISFFLTTLPIAKYKQMHTIPFSTHRLEWFNQTYFSNHFPKISYHIRSNLSRIILETPHIFTSLSPFL